MVSPHLDPPTMESINILFTLLLATSRNNCSISCPSTGVPLLCCPWGLGPAKIQTCSCRAGRFLLVAAQVWWPLSPSQPAKEELACIQWKILKISCSSKTVLAIRKIKKMAGVLGRARQWLSSRPRQLSPCSPNTALNSLTGWQTPSSSDQLAPLGLSSSSKPSITRC